MIETNHRKNDNQDEDDFFENGGGMNKQEIIARIQANRALLEKFSVKSISVFGSVVRDELRPDSDVDILVEFHSNARIGLFTFVHLKNQLSDLLGCPVDLVTPDALHPALREDILGEAVHVA
jgi:predicted nucleotidyltransferase